MSVIQNTKQFDSDVTNEEEFNEDYSMFGIADATEQNQSFKFKRINDYIENHYHDSNSDIEMEENNSEYLFKFYEIYQY